MDHRRIYSILEAVACKEGVSLEEVVFEIESAISAAYQSASLSNSGALIQLWDEVPRKGDIPSAVELIDFLSMKVLADKQSMELQNDQTEDDSKGRPCAGPCS